MSNPKSKRVRLTFVVPEEIQEQFIEDAKEGVRSPTNWLEYIVSKWYELRLQREVDRIEDEIANTTFPFKQRSKLSGRLQRVTVQTSDELDTVRAKSTEKKGAA